MDVAQVKFCSKIDLSNVYKQVHIELEDIYKTTFVIVYGTCKSNVLQQGDCNGPATFQRLMTAIFQDKIGIFVHVYLDDLFVFTVSIEDHEKDLEYVFKKLQEFHLFLEKVKCDLYSKHMDCLGHLINDQGLYTAMDKMACVCEWHTPRNLKDIQ